MKAAALAMLWLVNAVAIAAPNADPPPTGTSIEAPDDAAELSPGKVDRALEKLFEAKDYAGARALIERALGVRPKDFSLHYNLACALALEGNEKAATDSLYKALSCGFVDYFDLERDPHLASIRDTTEYLAVIKGWRSLLDARADANFGGIQDAFGTSYTYEKDDSLRLLYASAVEKGAFASAKVEITRVSEWAQREIFGEPPEDVARPDPWVSVILPTPIDFFRLIRADNVGGIYDKNAKRLVAQDIGPTLRHEFLHVLHWRDLSRRGQEHPLWVMEGLACLVEEMEPSGEIGPSWRTNIAKRLERGGSLVPLERFTKMTRQQYMNLRPRATYAQSRAIFMYILAQGKLREWYTTYTDGFAKDPTGAHALESVLGAPLKDIDKSIRAWLRELPEVAEVDHPGDATLGVELSPGSGDGPVVIQSNTTSPPGAERLRRRDVIEMVNGRATRNLDDLTRVLGELRVGDQVTVAVRRGTKRLEIPVTLVVIDEASTVLP